MTHIVPANLLCLHELSQKAVGYAIQEKLQLVALHVPAKAYPAQAQTQTSHPNPNLEPIKPNATNQTTFVEQSSKVRAASLTCFCFHKKIHHFLIH